LGGICGSNIYLSAQAPDYPTGFGVCLAICACGIIAAIVLRREYDRENKRRDAMIANEGEDAVRARFTEMELIDMGDRSPFFRYTL
jgi:predicted outer membrane lipoprotein